MDLADIGYLHWLVLGGVLLVGELAVAGTSYLVWLALAALGTGVIAWLIPLGWQGQLGVFAVLTVVALVLWRRYVTDDAPAEVSTLNQRGIEHVGRVVALDEGIVGGRGRVRIDDTLWMVTGPDAPAGSRVRLVALDGNIYRVELAG